MKKILMAFAGAIFCLSNAQAQTNTLDAMLTNVNQSSVTSGIIYERATPFANLYNFNATYDTATLGYFEQAFSELYKASNQTLLVPYTNLRQLYTAANQTNVIDIGVINTQFSILNYNEANPNTGGLTLNNNQFYQIAGAAPFINLHKLIIAPLRENAVGQSFTFNFRNDLLFSNGTQTITNLTANLGDGVVRNIISGGAIATSSVTITYSSSGDKVLSFTATFSDGSIITTNGQLFAKVISQNTTFGADPLIEDGEIIDNAIGYQGYTETAIIHGQLQYRIFYHNNNGNTQPIMLKPIIISDGFDPGDSRKIQRNDYQNYQEGVDHSIEDMMRYQDCNDPTKKASLIEILRAKGYDVVIVNYPKYTASNGQEIDGGADYIERNAMNMISLIQMLKTRLDATGSSEQLVVVGPSMGGQITRYALAFMEKKYAETGDSQWLHRTRLWISVDSPHLGANIPYGAQSLIYQLKDEATSAADFYNNWLGSVAAKQQLIELHSANYSPGSLNGRTISQGFSSNAGSSFYQQYYNNLFNNGLSGSNGYPMNLRKIALVNGSLTGKKTATLQGVGIGDFGNNGEQRFNTRGFTHTYWWDNFIVSLEGNNMPAYGISGNVSRYFRFLSTSLGNYQSITNINSRGSMDIVPGGYYPTWDILDKSISSQNPPVIKNPWSVPPFTLYFSLIFSNVHFETNTNAKISSFIPSYSALGIKNPEQDWSQPLNRNLVCSNETPFDSYFGHDYNTQHTSFDCESVTWLLKELDGLPQAPWYPLKSEDITGSEVLCIGSNTIYSFASNCQLPSSATWTTSSNLQLVSSTSSSITVTGLNNGNGTITATFLNGYTVTKTILVGAGNPPANIGGNYDANCGTVLNAYAGFDNPTITGFLWTLYNANTGATITENTSTSINYGDFYRSPFVSNPVIGQTYHFNLSVQGITSCGNTASAAYIFPITIGPIGEGPCGRPNLDKIKPNLQSNTNLEDVYTTVKIYPNPAYTSLVIILPKDSLNLPTTTITITDISGRRVKQITTVKETNIIPVAAWASGTYIIAVKDGKKRIIKKVVKN